MVNSLSYTPSINMRYFPFTLEVTVTTAFWAIVPFSTETSIWVSTGETVKLVELVISWNVSFPAKLTVTV